MVSMSSLHSLTAEIHGGMLMLAFACILVVALSQIMIANKKLFPKSFKIFIDIAIKIRGYAEPTGYIAIVGGLIGLFLSTYTGIYAWPQEEAILSEEIRNKITLTVFSIVLWTMVLAVRMKFGRGLWTCPPMMIAYTLLAAVAMAVTGADGSLGAHLTKGESLMDPIWDKLQVTITEAFVMEPVIAGVMALGSLAGLLLSLIYAKREGLFDVKLGPETSQRSFKWDEPILHTDRRRE